MNEANGLDLLSSSSGDESISENDCSDGLTDPW